MFHVNIDLSAIQGLLGLTEAAKQEMKKAGDNLTEMTRAHIIEKANQKLHSRRQIFIDALSTHRVNDSTTVISLEGKARWIDDGMEPHNMLDDLLGSAKAKRAKDGSTYIVIPFGQKGGAASTTPAQQSLIQTVRAELQRREIPYGTLETDDSGKPKLGKLHSFDIMDRPTKTSNGPGQGQGPIGAVKQGWSEDKKSGIPMLQGINIYQNKVKDAQGHETVRRDIMTFRIASSKQRAQVGRWDHPGTAPVYLMEDGEKWAREHWEKVVGPAVLQQVMISVT